MRLSVAYDFVPRRPSARARRVMELFGVDEAPGRPGRHVLARSLRLNLHAQQVVYFTGPSGSGKSSLLRECIARLPAQRVCRIDRLRLPRRALVDALPLRFEAAMELLSACGLGEARLLLRTPGELSDGQRHRFRLALGLARLECGSKAAALSSVGRKAETSARAKTKRELRSRTPKWLACDEFTATLDRTLAKVVAFNVRRLADRTGVGFLLAGCHEDIIGDLAPDLLLRCDLDGEPSVEEHEPQMNTD